MKIYNFILSLILFCNAGCDKLVDYSLFIKIQNNSSDTIRCFASYNYPDTSLPFNKPSLQMIRPQGYTKIEDTKLENVSTKDTILVFILREDTVDKYSWDVIRSQYKILKRYNVTISDLQKQNGTVTYP